MAYYANDYYEYGSPPHPPPPPPPRPAEFVVPGPPPSAFSPTGDRFPPSPLVLTVSPDPSRSSSQARGRSHTESSFLSTSGYPVHRSNSERGRIMVERHRARSRHGRSQSGKVYYEPKRTTYYIDNDSVCSESSYEGDSRDHSRARSRSRSRHRSSHSRASSCASVDSVDRYAVAPYRSHYLSAQEEELNAKLAELQKQLEKVQVDAERKKMSEEKDRMERLRNQEIEKKVEEKLILQKKKEEEEARRKAAAAEEEKRRIVEAAKRLVEEQKAAEEAAANAEKQKKAEIEAIIKNERKKYEQEQQQFQQQQPPKTTYTRFSKVHLCREALEERKIVFTEDADNFLVHRMVDKEEQQYLWARTKEIRNYYQQIQIAAERAPTVPGPNGGYVKYVQITGQPYPIALPVTITQTPGGGQTQRVDPVKIKWSDIFKTK